MIAAETMVCEKCGKRYMLAHQHPDCPHPRLVDVKGSWKLSPQEIFLAVGWGDPSVEKVSEATQRVADAACKHLAEKVLEEIRALQDSYDGSYAAICGVVATHIDRKLKAEGIL